jgi:S-formylglutathione hydrolase FrmB
VPSRIPSFRLPIAPLAALLAAGSTLAGPRVPQAVPTAPPPPDRDEIRITLPTSAATDLGIGETGTSGRLLVFLLRDGARVGRAEPMDAPFFRDPQPLFGLDVTEWKPGETRTIDARSLGWPVSLDRLEGGFRVQAVLKKNRNGRGHLAPGNLFGGEAGAEFTVDGSERVELSIDRAIEDAKPAERPNLRWIEFRSELLSKALGTEVKHRVGVVLPKDYDDLAAKRRHWPAVYVIPGFGGNHLDAARIATLMAAPRSAEVLPQAVHVVLDPEGPLGHHGFVDGPNVGPRGTALVTELIPHLESRLRLVAKPEARVVTGHSSGGWSSLWLQLNHPETFGACFASAPDPVDFSYFQTTDLYRDANLFTDAEGKETPSYREPLGPVDDRVRMTVREEIGVENVLGPRGDSGEQWGAWAAMFSSRDPATRMPRRAWNPETGGLDRATVEEDWSRYDIARMVAADWKRFDPIFAGKIRLLCGDRDSFYLERAVRSLREKTDALRKRDAERGLAPAGGPGYIELIRDAGHDEAAATAALRWGREMREHFRRYGLGD